MVEGLRSHIEVTGIWWDLIPNAVDAHEVSVGDAACAGRSGRDNWLRPAASSSSRP